MLPSFIPSSTPPIQTAPDTLWFAFMDHQLLIDPEAPVSGIPQVKQLADLEIYPTRTQFLGYLGDRPCYSAELQQDVNLPSGMELNGLRPLYPTLGDELFTLAGRAFQIKEWDRTHQYCGACAHPTHQVLGERAKRCSACGLVNYPRLSSSDYADI